MVDRVLLTNGEYTTQVHSNGIHFSAIRPGNLSQFMLSSTIGFDMIDRLILTVRGYDVSNITGDVIMQFNNISNEVHDGSRNTITLPLPDLIPEALPFPPQIHLSILFKKTRPPRLVHSMIINSMLSQHMISDLSNVVIEYIGHAVPGQFELTASTNYSTNPRPITYYISKKLRNMSVLYEFTKCWNIVFDG